MRPRLLTRSIKALFGVKKRNIAFELRRDEYYRNVYFDKSRYETLEVLAKANHMSRKRMNRELFDRGVRVFLGEIIGEYNRQIILAREQGQHGKVKGTPFIYMLRRWAKAKGYDISKFI
jgi:hypothetical protein